MAIKSADRAGEIPKWGASCIPRPACSTTPATSMKKPMKVYSRQPACTLAMSAGLPACYWLTDGSTIVDLLSKAATPCCCPGRLWACHHAGIVHAEVRECTDCPQLTWDCKDAHRLFRAQLCPLTSILLQRLSSGVDWSVRKAHHTCSSSRSATATVPPASGEWPTAAAPTRAASPGCPSQGPHPCRLSPPHWSVSWCACTLHSLRVNPRWPGVGCLYVWVELWGPADIVG